MADGRSPSLPSRPPPGLGFERTPPGSPGPSIPATRPSSTLSWAGVARSPAPSVPSSPQLKQQQQQQPSLPRSPPGLARRPVGAPGSSPLLGRTPLPAPSSPRPPGPPPGLEKPSSTTASNDDDDDDEIEIITLSHEKIITRLKEYRALLNSQDRDGARAKLAALAELLKTLTQEAQKHEIPYVSVNGELDFNVLRTGESFTRNVQVGNTAKLPFRLSHLTLVPPRDEFVARMQAQVPISGGGELVVNPGQEIFVSVTATGMRDYGQRKADLLAIINDSVVLVWPLTVRVKPSTTFDFGEALYADPYVPQALQRLSDEPAALFTNGMHPPFPSLHERLMEGVPHTPQITNDLNTSVLLPDMFNAEVAEPPIIELRAETYRQHFDALVAIELVAQKRRLGQQQLYHANVTQDPSMISRFHAIGLNPNIAVFSYPGLMDDQPRVHVGDAVRIRLQSSNFDGVDHIAYVWNVDRRAQLVYVAVTPQFPFFATYNVRLQLKEDPFYNSVRAVKFLSETSGVRDWLFPTAPEEDRATNGTKELQEYPSFKSFNPALNYEQRLAVQRIAEDSYGRYPFLIFGPPGTGKTSTVVESILQVLQLRPDAKILATAPSNSAADTIIRRLIPHLKPNEMFRLNNPSRTYAEVTDEILPHTYSSNGYFAFPDKKRLLNFRVVVSTCQDASFLVLLGLSNAQYEATFAAYHGQGHMMFPAYHPQILSQPHWTHCFVDECAQATEPEICIPLSVVYRKPPSAGAGTVENFPQVVLCGDYRQLGPRVVSDLARQHGLNVSLLERLKSLPLYSKEVPGRTPPFVHLVRNYRSHPGILMTPSHLFYDNSLMPFADQKLVNSMSSWKELKSTEFPIAFYGVNGKDEGIGNGDSWYNDDEIAKVVDVVESLMADSSLGVDQSDFGVIAPFREQVRRIRLALREKKWAGINVGTVEDYQGMERKIIIISCVRSSAKFLARDKESDIGIIHNNQRMNVAITRAQALLIIVGNPYTLATATETWAPFLAFLSRHGCVFGAELPLSLVLAAVEAGTLERAHDYDLFVKKKKPLGAALGFAAMNGNGMDEEEYLVPSDVIESMLEDLELNDGGIRAAIEAEELNGRNDSE